MARRDDRLFLGRWRFVESDVWDLDDLDLVEAEHILFGSRGEGSFALIAMQADPRAERQSTGRMGRRPQHL